MDIARAVADIPGATPAFGIPDAWMWSPAPGLVFAGALSADGEHLFRVNTRDSFDESLVRDVFVFAREHSADLLADDRPLVPLTGFASAGAPFDTVTGIRPDLRNPHENEHTALREVNRVIFAAYEIEFSGVETFDEAYVRLRHHLRLADMRRDPAPFLKMRYENTKTRGGSEGDRRGLADLGTLQRELTLLEGTTDSFVEFENRKLEVWSVRWDGEWIATGVQGERRFDLDALVTWAQERILSR